jgi:hypothetical protein
VSNFLERKRLHDYLTDEIDGSLRAPELAKLIPPSRVPRPVYSEVVAILREWTTRHQLADYLKADGWTEIEYWLEQGMKDAPPMYIYLDAVDDNFQAAPMYWLQCQKGLFLETLRLQSSDLGRRLHIVVSIRDLVFSSLLLTEQAARYRTSPYIRLLEWDYPSIRFFLREKIRRLDNSFRMRPGLAGVEGWLGRTTIANRARDVEEDVEDYLLRHTRLIPRDVVELGNALCHEVNRARAYDVEALSDETLRRVVGAAAQGFAFEQIRVCANQIASDDIPELGGQHRSSDFFIGTDEYARHRAQELIDVLAEVGGDRFDREACLRLREAR